MIFRFSQLARSDPDAPAIRAHYEYAPFGAVTAMTGDSAAGNPIRFSTKRQDEATGLLYYGYRDLDAVSGRWLRRDPLGERAGPLLYAICNNACVDRIDILGLTADSAENEACLTWKRLWDESIHMRPTGKFRRAWIRHARLWEQYLSEIDCPVAISCKECCLDDEQGVCGTCGMVPTVRVRFGDGAIESTEPTRKSTCVIKICANRCEDAKSDTPLKVLGHLIHELTHCWQGCRGKGTTDCRSCICNEIQAYHRALPDADNTRLFWGALDSCVRSAGSFARQKPWCTQDEFVKLTGPGPRDIDTLVHRCLKERDKR
jgi:RHS repeat-associated protein